MIVHKLKAQSNKWFKLRSQFITGTDIASLFGLNKNKSIGALIKEKQGLVSKQDNAFLRSGRVLEPSVVLLMNEYGMPAEPAGQFNEVVYVQHDSLPIGTSLDAKMNVDEGFYVVECKTTRADKLATWLDGVPINYLLQVQTQLLVTGLPKGLIAGAAPIFVEVYKSVEALDFLLTVHEISANERIHEIISEESIRFWNCFKNEEKFVVNKDLKKEIENIIYNGVTEIFIDNRLKS